MSTTDDINELLQRYKDGVCTPEEISLIEQWFDQVLRDNNATSLLTAADEERIIQRLKEHPRFHTPLPSIGKKRRPGLFRRFSRMAAAVWIGLLLSGLAVWLANQQKSPVRVAHDVTFLEVQAAAGQRMRVVLPDSSVVWLNSQSRLAYHPDFAAHRQVRLIGEAFFEVTHDQVHPFTVDAGKAFTRVYGTAFNIAAWKGAGELRIALQRGSIGIIYDGTKTGGEKILSPGQLFIYNKQTEAVQILAENVEDMGGWVSGKLIFNQVPLKEVLAQLERQYNITCIYNSTSKNPMVTARFENASLKKIMEHLSFGWDIRFKDTGDTLYVE